MSAEPCRQLATPAQLDEDLVQLLGLSPEELAKELSYWQLRHPMLAELARQQREEGDLASLRFTSVELERARVMLGKSRYATSIRPAKP